MLTRRAAIAGALIQAVRLGAQTRVERWSLYDVELRGPGEGNPFLDVRLSAQFRHEHRTIDVDGFYDGDGLFKIRFSPDAVGEWSYTDRKSTRLNSSHGYISYAVFC